MSNLDRLGEPKIVLAVSLLFLVFVADLDYLRVEVLC